MQQRVELTKRLRTLEKELEEINKDLEALVRSTGFFRAKARALVHEANSRGGRDNIAVVLVQARERKPRASWLGEWLGAAA